MNDTIYIYTDGACSGNPGPGGWAAVIVLPENRVKELGGREVPATNNRMELTAAAKALEFVQGRAEKIRLFTDSALLVNGMRGWIYGWMRNGWKTASGTPVSNRELWEKISGLSAGIGGNIEWINVKGHAGFEINERCDGIAVSFSRKIMPKLYDGPAVGCGYSLLEPEPEFIQNPSSVSSRARKKPAGKFFYISVVDGKALRHDSWDKCRSAVNGVRGARYKKFVSETEAKQWLGTLK